MYSGPLRGPWPAPQNHDASTYDEQVQVREDEAEDNALAACAKAELHPVFLDTHLSEVRPE